MNTFLPQGYTTPKDTGNYMKFQEGPNKFRILSSAITGWVEFDNDKKPHRYRNENKPRTTLSADGKLKPFWAMKVWNYAEKKVQVLELTQKTIMGALEVIVKGEDWGHPTGYDLIIAKSGEGLDTEYNVTPVPPKPLAEEIKKEDKEVKVNLNALYEGKDPFAVDDLEVQIAHV